ncbi:uncharacterized protein ZBAI_05784 [Zygosaccharomyces bailii ISA1307]|nr:uncharacterized protein ZBAI_05784 [Zygosaccharomyces bailii ISA1307]
MFPIMSPIAAPIEVYGFCIEPPAVEGTSPAQFHHQHPRLAKPTATEPFSFLQENRSPMKCRHVLPHIAECDAHLPHCQICRWVVTSKQKDGCCVACLLLTCVPLLQCLARHCLA